MPPGIRFAADTAGNPAGDADRKELTMFSWKQNRKRRPTFLNATGGPVGKRLAEQLASEPESGARPSDTEQVVASSVGITASHADQEAARAIQGASEDLRAAVAATMIAMNDETRQHGEHEMRQRAERRKEQGMRQRQTLAEPIDHAAPLISHRVLASGELVLTLLEIGFWYAVFSADIDRRVSWLSGERLSAAGLALLIPVLSIFAARLVGPAWQRALRYTAPDKRQRRNQLAAAGVGLLLIAFTGVVTGGLVQWRYSSDNALNTFASLPPASWMTGVFVLVVVIDALLRAFSDSEQDKVNKQRDTAVTADQHDEKRICDAVVQSKLAWADKYDRLQHLVNHGLDEIEQIVFTGEQILLLNRGRRAGAPETTTPQVGPAAEPTTDDAFDTPRLGDVTMQWHIEANLLRTRLRVHATALRVLAHYVPPTLRPDSQALDATALQAVERTKHLDQRLLAFLKADEPAAADAGAKIAAGSDAPPSGAEGPSGPGRVATTKANGKDNHVLTS